MSRNPHAASLRAHKPKRIEDKRDGNLIEQIRNETRAAQWREDDD
jgi:hypothetical protein